jgi:hypothetical protein
MAKNGSSSSSSSSRSKGDVPTHPGAVAPGSEGHLVSANGSGLRERFDAFWDAYPKQEERVAAWDAWQKLRPDSELTAQMCAALVWQRRKDDWLRDSGRFIPLPAKWLTGRRWLDKPTATPRLSDKTIAISRTIQEFSKS